MRWSSGFLKSSWMTLWSTYWTARSTGSRNLELLELHARHRARGVLEQGLVHAQGDGRAGPQLPLDEVLGRIRREEALGHARVADRPVPGSVVVPAKFGSSLAASPGQPAPALPSEPRCRMAVMASEPWTETNVRYALSAASSSRQARPYSTAPRARAP